MGEAQLKEKGRIHAREVTAQQIFIKRETTASSSLHQHKNSAQQPQHTNTWTCQNKAELLKEEGCSLKEEIRSL
jgi:hypothetical protein